MNAELELGDPGKSKPLESPPAGPNAIVAGETPALQRTSRLQ